MAHLIHVNQICQMLCFFLTILTLDLLTRPVAVTANPDSKKLYAELLSTYNKLVRPVGNNSDRLTIKMGLKLSQLIDVNLRTQIMTTNMWVEQEWMDYKLTWNPEEFGGVETLHVPSEHIWLPDIVLYNNADGNYEITMMTKAILNYTGIVKWKPPAIYKSYCEINVEYFPFDQQVCTMKFGSWTFDGYTVDLRHIMSTGEGEDDDITPLGIDLQDYYISVEWDIMDVPATRHEKYYSCCNEPFIDIIFELVIRRKTLFYTVNLIAPCVGITFLSILVFYLPSDSGEKMSLCISILLSLTVFFLLLAETIPPTSLAVPLLGKYLLFTMTLITFSVIVTICILNVNYRSPATHKMAPWVKTVFIEFLPKYLCLQRPDKDDDEDGGNGMLHDMLLNHTGQGGFEPHGLLVTADGLTGIESDTDRLQVCHIHGLNHLEPTTRMANAINYGGASAAQYPSLPSPIFMSQSDVALRNALEGEGGETQEYSPEIEKSVAHAKFIAQRLRNKDRFGMIEEDWKFVAMVLDRLFLWVFTSACVFGTAGIILQAPSLYDTTVPIDIQYSKIAKQKLMQMGSDEI